MLLKRYLNLSKSEIFILILLLIFSLLLFFGVKVEKNSISYLFIKVPLQVKGSISLIFWKNYHSVFAVFAFFAYLIFVVEDNERSVIRPFVFLLIVYLIFSAIFGLKFGFNPFLNSFVSISALLFTLFAHIFLFDAVFNSRGIGALYIILVNAFSGLLIYLYNFRDILIPDYASLIEAKYYALPLYQKYSLSFDYKNLLLPVLMFIATIAYKFLAKRKVENG
ncbi:hypothetical protein TTHT_1771 [Thermotomaculum hydrothermale]|uniref:Uncharacterized protein n=1 Tax=Thermotomaculum hydrothermale TaxID=981385 RepID=A0A7R6PRY9_9BACT|nr:hypothetical protein [Thermotomaculum hydrothermale]BBB33236.1 hypothetical protein TTHT_1771 [Thermotomaculum hydrothermale]